MSVPSPVGQWRLSYINTMMTPPSLPPFSTTSSTVDEMITVHVAHQMHFWVALTFLFLGHTVSAPNQCLFCGANRKQLFSYQAVELWARVHATASTLQTLAVARRRCKKGLITPNRDLRNSWGEANMLPPFCTFQLFPTYLLLKRPSESFMHRKLRTAADA